MGLLTDDVVHFGGCCVGNAPRGLHWYIARVLEATEVYGR
jgi:hypothetical protein